MHMIFSVPRNNEKQEWNSAVRKVYQKLSVDEGKAKKRGRSTAGNTADPGVNAKRNARPPAQKANSCKTTFWCGDQPQQFCVQCSWILLLNGVVFFPHFFSHCCCCVTFFDNFF